MSIEAMNWALEQRAGNQAAKHVLLILANRAHPEDGTCFPGIDGIAEQTELSRRSVIDKIKILQDAGLLCVVRRGGDGTGRKSNTYALHVGGRAKCRYCTLPEGQSADSAGQCADFVGQCAAPAPEPKEEPKEETSLSAPAAARDERPPRQTAADEAARRELRKAPAGWQPTDEAVTAMAAETGLPPATIRQATAKFVDHTFRARVFNFPERWRNWIRNEAARGEGSARGSPGAPPTDPYLTQPGMRAAAERARERHAIPEDADH